MWELQYFCVSTRLRSIQAYRSQVLGFHPNSEEVSTFGLKALFCKCELYKAKQPPSIHCIYEYIWMVPWVSKNLHKWKGEHRACSFSAVKQQPCWATLLMRQATGSSSPHLARALRWPPAQAEHELTAGKFQSDGVQGEVRALRQLCALDVPPNWNVVCVEVCFLCLFLFWNVQLQKLKYLHRYKWNFSVSFFCHQMEYSYVQQVNYFPWGSDTKLFSIQRTINWLLQLYTFWSRSFPVFRGDACPIAPISAVCQASQ